jgi:replicative DNA helicase
VAFNESSSGVLFGGRVPPHALDFEMALLGAVMVDGSAIPSVIEILEFPEAFYREAHRKIYAVVIGLFRKDEPVDLLTVSEELRRKGELDSVGGVAYLAEITGRVSSAANAEHYAKVVAEKSILRSLMAAASEIGAKSTEEGADAFEMIDSAETTIFEIAQRHLRKNFVSIKKLATETLEMLSAIHGQHSGITGVPTGFTKLDELTGGFQKSDLIIIAARPSMGKTALAMSIARNAAVDHKIAVAVFNLEMSSQQLALRLLCSEARVNMQEARTGRLPESEWPKLSAKVGRLATSPMFIDDTPALTVLELRAKSRRLKNEHDIGMIVIDYLQLMSSPKTMESREREISTISRSLKALAKELNIPIVALSQLNRQVEGRTDKRPMLSDLRESGAIEQDADVVMFIHRPEVYGILAYDDDTPTEGTAEILIGKQRNGPIGDIRVAFHRQWAMFENLAPAFLSREEYLPPIEREVDTPF